MEIIIAEPKFNHDPHSSYSYTDRDMRDFDKLRNFRKYGITSETHPKAIDICAGDGSWARILCDNGWKEENILCVDRYKSGSPLVSGVESNYWDINALGKRLFLEHDQTFSAYMRRLLSGQIPPEVLEKKGVFDLAVLGFGTLKQSLEEEVCNFFVRPKGHIYIP